MGAGRDGVNLARPQGAGYPFAMILPGRLRSTTLGDVLGRLHRAKACGELELIGNDAPYRGSQHRIVLRDGLVCDVRTPLPVPPLGEVLLRQGDISAQQHQRFVLQLHRQRTVMAGELLVHEGYASRQQVSSGLGRQTRLRLDALFALRDADLRFHPLARPAPESPLTPVDFLYGRRRARDATPAAPARHSLHEAYERLGLSPGATRQDVRRAFRRLASSVHPDLHANVSEPQRRALEARFAELSGAYHAIITTE